MKKYLAIALTLIMTLSLLASVSMFTATATGFTPLTLFDFEGVESVGDLDGNYFVNNGNCATIVNNQAEGLTGAQGSQAMKLENCNWNGPLMVLKGSAGDADSVSMYIKADTGTDQQWNFMTMTVGEQWNTEYNEARNRWGFIDQFTVSFYFLDGTRVDKTYGSGFTNIYLIDKDGNIATSFEGYISIKFDQFQDLDADAHTNTAAMDFNRVSIGVNGSYKVYVDNVQAVQSDSFDPYKQKTDFTPLALFDFEGVESVGDLDGNYFVNNGNCATIVNNQAEGLTGAQGSQAMKLENCNWNGPLMVLKGSAGDADSVSMYIKADTGTDQQWNFMSMTVGEQWNTEYNEVRNRWGFIDQFTVSFYFLDGTRVDKTYGSGFTNIYLIDKDGNIATSFEGYISIKFDQFQDLDADAHTNTAAMDFNRVSIGVNGSYKVYVDNVQVVQSDSFVPYNQATEETTTTTEEVTTTTTEEVTTTTTEEVTTTTTEEVTTTTTEEVTTTTTEEVTTTTTEEVTTTTTEEVTTTTTIAPVQKDEALMQDFEGITDLKKDLPNIFWTQSYKKVALVNNAEEGLKGAQGSQALKMFDSNWNSVVIYNATGDDVTEMDAVAMYVKFSSNEYNLLDLVVGETWNNDYMEARNQWKLKSGFQVTYCFMDGSKYTKTFGADDTKLRAIDKNGNDAASFEGYIVVALDQFIPMQEYENKDPLKIASVSLGVNGSNIVYVDDVKVVKMDSFQPYEVEESTTTTTATGNKDDNTDDKTEIPDTGYTSYVLLALLLCVTSLTVLLVSKKQNAKA